MRWVRGTREGGEERKEGRNPAWENRKQERGRAQKRGTQVKR